MTTARVTSERATNQAVAHPVWLWLDPTTRCNLACSLCYTKQSHGTLDLDPLRLAEVLRAFRQSPAVSVKSIHLNWRGEPLMNPRFAELLGMVRDEMPDVFLQWHTNGTMLTPKRVDEIMAIGWPHKIFVSIDGGNEKGHDRNRGAGTFRRTIRGLKNLLAHPKRDGLVTVGIYQIDLGEPEENYDPEFVRLTQAVDHHVKVAPLLPGGVEHQLVSIDSLNSDDDLNRMMAEELNPRIPVPHGPCFWAGHVMCMAPNGDTWICIVSHGSLGVVGNLMTESPDLVIGRALNFREKLIANGRRAVAHCRNCRKPEGHVFDKHVQSAPAPRPAAVAMSG